MKVVSGAELARLLEGKGWKLMRVSGSHHIYAREGHPARISVPVHGNRLLKPGLDRMRSDGRNSLVGGRLDLRRHKRNEIAHRCADRDLPRG